ncbi:hypothetical protein [Stigmatella aurantiaca]|uniref:hypothetical protein n=1 Tax=Stigmatella aurantiaca TaxID=41 RepID=UPI0011601DCA|nr:hypothetical protein [Stigmatella aurantiaca]
MEMLAQFKINAMARGSAMELRLFVLPRSLLVNVTSGQEHVQAILAISGSSSWGLPVLMETPALAMITAMDQDNV